MRWRLAVSASLLGLVLACGAAPKPTARSAAPAELTREQSNELGVLIDAGAWPRLVARSAAIFAATRAPDAAFYASYGELYQKHAAAAIDWLEKARDAGFTRVNDLADPDFEPLRRDPRFVALEDSLREAAKRHLAELGVGSGLVASTPAAEGIDEAALQTLRAAAATAHSSALVVLRHGKKVEEAYFGGVSEPTETMSATKGLSSLAVGAALQDGLLRSLDAPMTEWFPSWKDGVHDGITLRHVLTHTSNLDAPRRADAIYQSGDAIGYALGLKMAGPPGAAFFYNNAATNLLAGVIRGVTQKPLDAYYRERVLAPLGIREVEWQKDAKGNPYAMAGLQMHALDLAKLGQLVLQKGAWNGRQVVAPAYIEAMCKPAQPYRATSGLLWWVGYPKAALVLDDAFFQKLEASGAPAEVRAGLATLKGQRLGPGELVPALFRTLGPKAPEIWANEVAQRKVEPREEVEGAPEECSARGSFGQLVAVFPQRDLVVVRLTREFSGNDPRVEFGDFDTLAKALVPLGAGGAVSSH
jgi:CubicO group peptidase (beta-lactamase class C family)